MRSAKITSRERFLCYLLFILPAILDTFNIPGQHAVVSMCFLLVSMAYLGHRRFWSICRSFPLMVWLILTLFHVINAYVKHVPEVNAIDMLHGLKIYSCIAIITFWACVDFRKTVKILTSAFIIRCLVVLLLLLLFPSAFKEGERLSGAGGSATGLGHMAAITGIFITFLNALHRKTMIENFMLFLIPLMVVVLTQSRNSLAMILISFFVSIMLGGKNDGKIISLKQVLILSVFFIVLAVAYSFFSNSNFAQRFNTEEYEESNFYQNNATGTFFDDIVGDRLVYYVQGWEFFLQSPLTGIGMWNYKHLTGGYYPLHSEYMVHLCEGGLVATALWLTFILYVIKVIVRESPNTHLKIAAISTITVLLFCGIYAREFFYEMFYPTYGLILSFHFKNHKRRFILHMRRRYTKREHQIKNNTFVG